MSSAPPPSSNPASALSSPALLLKNAFVIYGNHFALFTTICLVPQMLGALPQVLFFSYLPDASGVGSSALNASSSVAGSSAVGGQAHFVYFLPVFAAALLADGICIVALSVAYFCCALKRPLPSAWQLSTLGLAGPWLRATFARLLISAAFAMGTTFPVLLLGSFLGTSAIGLLPVSSLLGVYLGSSFAVVSPMLCLQRCGFGRALRQSTRWVKKSRFAGFVVLGYAFVIVIFISTLSYALLHQTGLGPLSPIIASMVHAIALPLSYGPQVLLYQALLHANAESPQAASQQEQQQLQALTSFLPKKHDT